MSFQNHGIQTQHHTLFNELPFRFIVGAEEELFVRLALITKAEVEGASGLRERALRAIDPDQARDDEDRLYRSELRKKITSEVIPDLKWSPGGPGLIPNYQVPLELGESCSGILVRAELIDKFIGKIVRGITYHDDALYLDSKCEITVKLVDENQSESIKMQSFLNRFEALRPVLGPGFRVDRYVTEEDRRMSVFRIIIWQHFVFRAVVIPRKYDHLAFLDPTLG